MRMEFVKLAFEALKERKIRSGLTILMVLIGSALLIAIDGLSNGTQKFIDDEFKKFGTNLVVVTQRGGSNFEIKDWFVDEIKKWDEVLDVVPFIQQVATLYYRGKTRSVMVEGLDQSKLPLIFIGLEIEKGSFVSQSDRVGVLLGNQIAYSFGDEPINVGQTIQLYYSYVEESGKQETNKKSFVVRGVLSYFGSFAVPIDQVVFLSLEAAKELFNKKDKYDGVFILTVSDKYNDIVVERIREKYDVDILTPQSIKKSVDNIVRTISFFISSISFVSLLVASIGIITTLYTSMLERIREIGILKAIGFKNYHVLKLFLYEAALIGITGASLGLVSGVALANLLKEIFFKDVPFLKPFFSINVMINTWIIAVGLSILSGLYPSWRASRLDPVVALKYE